MGQLVRASASRLSGEWSDDDYDVLCEGAVVGRIMKSAAAPVGQPWLWTLAYGHHEDRTPTHGYEPTREAAMTAFARSWRRDKPQMLDHDAIYFPKAEIPQPFAMAFMRMMFAHAEFEEQVRRLQATIIVTPAKQHVFAHLRRLLNFGRKTDGDLGKARDRPKRMAKLIKARPDLVKDQEAKQIDQILRAAIGPCDRRNLLAHGRWWRFNPKTSTIRIRGERRREPEWDNYTEQKILEIDSELTTLADDLNEIKRAIENRRGDHDVPGFED
jgi:hypothetical protein